jgi:hypothetical protein
VASKVYRVMLERESVRTTDTVTRKGERTIGHEFAVAIELEDIRGCILEWWEKTDTPYDERMKPNQWVDMFKLEPTSAVFAPWVYQTITVPFGRAAFSLRDPPGIMATKATARDLFFDIRVRDAIGNYRHVKAHQRLSLNPKVLHSEVFELTIEANDLPGFGLGPPSA